MNLYYIGKFPVTSQTWMRRQSGTPKENQEVLRSDDSRGADKRASGGQCNKPEQGGFSVEAVVALQTQLKEDRQSQAESGGVRWYRVRRNA